MQQDAQLNTPVLVLQHAVRHTKYPAQVAEDIPRGRIGHAFSERDVQFKSRQASRDVRRRCQQLTNGFRYPFFMRKPRCPYAGYAAVIGGRQVSIYGFAAFLPKR
jgi:hypothetical protein